ncbi:MAG TPA: DUF2795 domain-containing protein [Gaiellaceae bacterium]|jgi:hypothetical protein
MQPHQVAAVAQVVLEGIPLPAGKNEIVEYARGQSAPAPVLAALERIPEQAYERLDAVGEAIVPRGPSVAPKVREPGPESGSVPGGEAYADAAADAGRIREEPEVLPYEEQLVREPASAGEGIPKKGSKAPMPARRPTF